MKIIPIHYYKLFEFSWDLYARDLTTQTIKPEILEDWKHYFDIYDDRRIDMGVKTLSQMCEKCLIYNFDIWLDRFVRNINNDINAHRKR